MPTPRSPKRCSGTCLPDPTKTSEAALFRGLFSYPDGMFPGAAASQKRLSGKILVRPGRAFFNAPAEKKLSAMDGISRGKSFRAKKWCSMKAHRRCTMRRTCLPGTCLATPSAHRRKSAPFPQHIHRFPHCTRNRPAVRRTTTPETTKKAPSEEGAFLICSAGTTFPGEVR